MHRRKVWSESGVSEVVGTILILAMTVVLFASIIVWVSTIPTPTATTRLDMDGSMAPTYDIGGAWTGANLTVQHRGGESLQSHSTDVLVQIDRGGALSAETLETRGVDLGVSYGIEGPDADWDVGETWAYLNYPVLATDRVTVLVIDTGKSLIVWSEILLGPTGTHPPFFIEKWTDGNLNTPFTIDIPLTDQTFGLYARIVDPDGDLDRESVTATFSFGGVGIVDLYDDGSNGGDALANDGVFTLIDADMQPRTSWDRGIVFFHAKDTAGHEADSRMVFQVVEGTTGGGGGSGGSGPMGFQFQNEFQAYGIFNDTEWDTLKYEGEETRRFKKGEVVVVIVASQYLRNVELQNDLMLYSASSLPPVPVVYSPPNGPDPSGASLPSSTRAFTFLEFVSDYYVYEFRFSTDSQDEGGNGIQLAYGGYNLEFTLRANNVPPPRNQFDTVDNITVTDASGIPSAYPALEFFEDAARTQPTTEFVFTDRMYVRVRVATNTGTLTAGDIAISDYLGGVQLWDAPGGTGPVSAITASGVAPAATYYIFDVDLSSNNRDPWVLGTNHYGFRVKLLSDPDEAYSLSAQISIRGPRWSLDVVSAVNEYAHPVHAEKWYAIFNDNDRLWSTYVAERFESSPGTQSPPFGGGKFYETVFSDLDEDGDLDFAVAIEKGYVFWYRNTDGRGHAWERFTVDLTSPVVEIKAIAAGFIDRDLDNDLVAGTKAGQIYWYRNDGYWTRTTIATLASQEVRAIQVGDADMDGDIDVFVGSSTGKVYIYRNDGTGGFSSTPWVTMSPNAEVHDLVVADVDDDGSNDVVVAYESSLRVYRGPAYTAILTTQSTTNPAWSVDVGYMNGDALLDIVVGTDSGNVYWFQNGAWATRTTVCFAPGACTTLPSDKLNSLRVGDVDGDLIDDIVVGTANGFVRWFRHTAAATWENRLILNLGTPVFDIDIGDADRGVVIVPSEY